MEENLKKHIIILLFCQTAMMQKKRAIKYFLTICLLFSCSVFVGAQTSLLPDINYNLMYKMIDTAKKYYPKSMAYNHRAVIATENIKKAKLSWLDLFSFSYLYSPNNSSTLVNPSVLNGYQFGIFLNFSALFTKPHNIKQAKEELAISKLEKEEYMRTLETEVKSRYFKYVQAQTILKIRNQATLDAENIMKQIQHKFEKSEDSYENYNKFSVEYADRRQASIEAETQLLIARSSLEELLCKKIEEIN
jgi:outer membrane protein TolC